MRQLPLNHKLHFEIIHIEDNPLDAKLIESALQVHVACHITTVTTKMALEAALKESPPDLFISDSSLYGFDGLAALNFVVQKFPEVPFIFCSGHVSDQKKNEALAQGATNYIPKSDLAGLIALVKSLCGDSDKNDGEATS